LENKIKKHNHFVPQVYLRKFAFTNKQDNYFVNVYDKITGNFDQRNIDKICIKNSLYLLDTEGKDNKEQVENLYQDTLEKDYNRFYQIVNDQSKNKITAEERELILITIISLHLRNYHWLKGFNDFWTGFIKESIESGLEKTYSERGDLLFSTEDNSISEIIDMQNKENKQVFIKLHLRNTLKWLKSRINNIIFISRTNSNYNFITSDKPVICDNIDSSMYLPIDSKTIITLMPEKEGLSYNPELVIRNNPFIDPRIFNVMQYESSQRLIIGLKQESLNQVVLDYPNLKD
jgi:hypothetical protein